MNDMTPEQFDSLTKQVELILSEIREIKDWQAMVDRGVKGEPVHGNPSYNDRINENKEEIARVAENVRHSHLRIDKVVYTSIGAAAGTGGIVAGIIKLILGI